MDPWALPMALFIGYMMARTTVKLPALVDFAILVLLAFYLIGNFSF